MVILILLFPLCNHRLRQEFIHFVTWYYNPSTISGPQRVKLSSDREFTTWGQHATLPF